MNMKNLYLFVFSSFIALSSTAQTEIRNLNSMPDTRLFISFSPVVHNDLNLRTNGRVILKSRNCPSAVLAAGASQRIFSNLHLNIAGEITTIGRNLFINNELSFDTINLRADWLPRRFVEMNDFFYGHFTYNLAISFEYMVQKSNNAFNTFEAGVKWNRLLNYPYSESMGISIQGKDMISRRLFKFEMSNTNRRVIPSFFVKVGLLKQSDKNSFKQIKFVANYSPYNIGEGTFRFYQIDYSSFGRASLGVNYIGVDFVHGWVLRKSYALKHQPTD
jgi:hypothetical protein